MATFPRDLSCWPLWWIEGAAQAWLQRIRAAGCPSCKRWAHRGKQMHTTTSWLAFASMNDLSSQFVSWVNWSPIVTTKSTESLEASQATTGQTLIWTGAVWQIKTDNWFWITGFSPIAALFYSEKDAFCALWMSDFHNCLTNENCHKSVSLNKEVNYKIIKISIWLYIILLAT